MLRSSLFSFSFFSIGEHIIQVHALPHDPVLTTANLSASEDANLSATEESNGSSKRVNYQQWFIELHTCPKLGFRLPSLRAPAIIIDSVLPSLSLSLPPGELALGSDPSLQPAMVLHPTLQSENAQMPVAAQHMPQALPVSPQGVTITHSSLHTETTHLLSGMSVSG